MKKFLYTIYIVSIVQIGFSQETNNAEYPESFKKLYATVFNGDTITELTIPEVNIVRYKFDNTREKYLYEKTKQRIEKVIPYYEIAVKVLEDLEAKEKEAKKREYNKYKRTTRRDLVAKFEQEIRDLTQGEGKILVKLINRNTGYSFNDLLKEYNNPVKVWGYNMVAKHYDYDLKETYDPNHPDNKYIEMALKALNFDAKK
jgi:hypothetical protein